MMLLLYLIAIGALLVDLATAQSTFTPTRPPSIPLAVRNPYLSTWLRAGKNGGNGGYLPGQWPTFWTGQYIGWTGLVRVDGKTYTWMGAPMDIEIANQVAVEYTSTRSIFTIEVDNRIQLKVTFLSPITPKDFKRQSLIFSYLEVEVSSLDGVIHDVQLYTDISAEWASGDIEAEAEWEYDQFGDISFHKVWRKGQIPFAEVNDRAEWGNIYYTTDSSSLHTHQSGIDDEVRRLFVEDGKLRNLHDLNFRPIGQDWPVFAHAVDLSPVGRKPVSTLFSIGLCQESAIQFLGEGGLRILPSLWKDYFSDEREAAQFFHKDYPEAKKLATELDEKISKDSIKAAGQDYLTLTSLAARQAFGGVQLVGTQAKPYLFMKEISSNGNTQTIDVIYPTSPIFYYLNPELVRLLLEPHFENQESGHYPHNWAIHDLGTHYPNATGHTDGLDEWMPLEECGNNLIMVLAYVQRSGNTGYIEEHYPMLKQWAEYLVLDSLRPGYQLSTDDFAGHLANQTNLALKGMIGLEAMSQISSLVGEIADAENYTTIAHDYIKQWMDLGINRKANPPHSILNYDNWDTHGLLYNLYNDALLNTSLVPPSVYAIQSAFYPTIRGTYGVPLDTRNAYTKSDWAIFAAAVASTETRDMFIRDVARWVGETPSSKPFTDLYMVEGGDHPPGIEFKARPVMGGMFALLAL